MVLELFEIMAYIRQTNQGGIMLKELIDGYLSFGIIVMICIIIWALLKLFGIF